MNKFIRKAFIIAILFVIIHDFKSAYSKTKAINEVMASNAANVADENVYHPGWTEFCNNRTSQEVAISVMVMIITVISKTLV